MTPSQIRKTFKELDTRNIYRVAQAYGWRHPWTHYELEEFTRAIRMGYTVIELLLYPEWTEKPSSGESVRKLPRDLLIQIDSREQHPLLFPDTVLRYTSPKSRTLHRIKTETVTLKEGDYRLASHPTAGVCERKAGLSELTQNTLSGDRPRFTRAINRLLGCCSHPSSS
jgi:hypothetical protein